MSIVSLSEALDDKTTRPLDICERLKDFKFHPRVECQDYIALTGWRLKLNRWFGVKFKKQRLFYVVGDGPSRDIFCSYATYSVIQKALDAEALEAEAKP